MFGGLCFLIEGHMCCGIIGPRLVVRIGPDHHERALREQHARVMDCTGGPIKGFVYVEPEGVSTKASLTG